MHFGTLRYVLSYGHKKTHKFCGF